MTLRSNQELINTQRKLHLLEEQYEKTLREPAENAYVRALTLRSLKRTINKFKEEIARYMVHATVSDKQ